MNINQMTRISLFAALMVVFTAVFPPIPIGGVPVTLQTLIVMFAGILLTPKEAFLSMVLYLVLGIIGLPVFSGFASGIGILLGPTGGFLLAFPLSAMLMSIARNFWKTSFKTIFMNSVFFGILLVYSIGIPILCLHLNIRLIDGVILMSPFLLFDGIKACIATTVAWKVNSMQNTTSYSPVGI